MTTQDLADACDEMARSEAAKHYSERNSHWVVLADFAIVWESPESQDPDDSGGPPCPASRFVKEKGCDRNMGREYHLPHGIDPLAARLVLMGIGQ